MAEYTTSVDVANRALIHCGVPLIGSFTDNSKNAVISGFLYDKVRQAELREHIWRFAVRSAILYPISRANTTQFVSLFTAWGVGTTYAIGSIVSQSGTLWLNHTTSLGGSAPSYINGVKQNINWDLYCGTLFANPYDPTQAYRIGALLVGADTNIYRCSLDAPVGAGDPSVTPAFWVLQNVSAFMGFSLQETVGVYTDGTSKNVFPYPNMYIRPANQDPKQAGTAHQRTTGGIQYSDFEFEADYVVSALPGPLIFRYVADTFEIAKMDTLFLEAISARLALAMMPTTTQNAQKIALAQAEYDNIVHRARLINALESGDMEPEADEVNRDLINEKDLALRVNQPRQQQQR